MKIVAPDDLAPGKLITIHNQPPVMVEGECGIYQQTNRNGMGELLEVVAVDLPYIIVKRLASNYNSSETFDVREATFAAVSKEFAFAKMQLFQNNVEAARFVNHYFSETPVE